MPIYLGIPEVLLSRLDMYSQKIMTLKLAGSAGNLIGIFCLDLETNLYMPSSQACGLLSSTRIYIVRRQISQPPITLIFVLSSSSLSSKHAAIQQSCPSLCHQGLERQISKPTHHSKGYPTEFSLDPSPWSATIQCNSRVDTSST
jgi:hypothetical protein